MAVLDHAQLEQAWTLAGGAPQWADTAASIAEAESGGNPSAINNSAYPNKPGYHKPGPGALPEYSVGLWQINLLAHPSYSVSQMLKPLLNAGAAVAISSDGQNFGAWSTYTSGAYRDHLLVPGATTPQPGRTTGTVSQAKQRQVGAAWARLMRVLAVDAPKHLRRTSAASARLRKGVR